VNHQIFERKWLLQTSCLEHTWSRLVCQTQNALQHVFAIDRGDWALHRRAHRFLKNSQVGGLRLSKPKPMRQGSRKTLHVQSRSGSIRLRRADTKKKNQCESYIVPVVLKAMEINLNKRNFLQFIEALFLIFRKRIERNRTEFEQNI